MNDKASPTIPLFVELTRDGHILVKFPENLSEEDFEFSFSLLSYLHSLMSFAENVLRNIEVQELSHPMQIIVRVPVNDSLRYLLEHTRRRASFLHEIFHDEKKTGKLVN